MQTAPSAQNTDDYRSQQHMAEPKANYIEHCHWLLVLRLSVTATHSLGSCSEFFGVRKL